jgi:hypothetical protein
MLQPLLQDIAITLCIGVVLLVARWLGIKLKKQNEKIVTIHDKIDAVLSQPPQSPPDSN